MKLRIELFEPKVQRALVLALGVRQAENLPDWLSGTLAGHGGVAAAAS